VFTPDGADWANPGLDLGAEDGEPTLRHDPGAYERIVRRA
jgi:hypothetical protein